VRDEAGVDAAARGEIARHVLAAEAVADGADAGEAQFAACIIYRGGDDALDFRLRVLCEPLRQVEARFLLFDGDGVPGE
jgi:hypothetical protein